MIPIAVFHHHALCPVGALHELRLCRRILARRQSQAFQAVPWAAHGSKSRVGLMHSGERAKSGRRALGSLSLLGFN